MIQHLGGVYFFVVLTLCVLKFGSVGFDEHRGERRGKLVGFRMKGQSMAPQAIHKMHFKVSTEHCTHMFGWLVGLVGLVGWCGIFGYWGYFSIIFGSWVFGSWGYFLQGGGGRKGVEGSQGANERYV